MAEKIYIRNASGGLEPLAEKPFESEAVLQKLIAEHPELLAGEQISPDEPLRWILVRREMPIDAWAMDHLLIDQHGRPTLVEVKRGSNSQIRREVVGQMLDYAATAAGVWSDRDLRQVFEDLEDDPDEAIGELLQDAEPDIDEFWERVVTNLGANRLRLLFVADEIPAELEQVVTFLNKQTRENLEVLAVEVKQYPGQFGDALVSRVIGQIDRVQPGPTSLVERKQAILDRCISPAVREALQSLTDAAVASGATVQWARIGVSIRQRCSLSKGGVFVARFRWWFENDQLPMELFVHRQDFRPYPQELRDVLQKWIDKFEHDEFAVEHIKSPNADEGWAVTESNFAENEQTITRRLVETLMEIAAL